MSLVEIETMTKVPAGRKKKIPAANMNIGHVGARIKRLPFLKMEDIFTNTEAPIIHDCVVSVGEQRFLISAHYRPTEAVNGGLQKAFPGYAWRGEIVAVALGRVNPYVDKVKNAIYKEAINKSVYLYFPPLFQTDWPARFMASFLKHTHMNEHLPPMI